MLLQSVLMIPEVAVVFTEMQMNYVITSYSIHYTKLYDFLGGKQLALNLFNKSTGQKIKQNSVLFFIFSLQFAAAKSFFPKGTFN